MTDSDDDYMPEWSEVQRWVRDRAHDRSRVWTDAWLENHPLDWLMVCRYLKMQVEDRIALANAHRRLHLDENGQEVDLSDPRQKRAIEHTRLRRLALRNALDDQLNHAKYLLGNTRIAHNTVADILSQLANIRSLLVDDSHEISDATNALDSLMRSLHMDEHPDDTDDTDDIEDEEYDDEDDYDDEQDEDDDQEVSGRAAHG